MLRSIDPLLYLRTNIQQNKTIRRERENLVFEDGTRLPINTPTAIIQAQSKIQYNIGSLWFYLKHREDSLAVYAKECFNEGMQCVIGLDKEKIADYFIRNIDNIDLIDKELKTKTLIFIGKKIKGESFRDLDKKEHNENNIHLKDINKNIEKEKNNRKKDELSDPNLLIMDYIYLNEKKSLNHNSMLKPVDNIQSYENLLNFCKKIFLKEGNISQHHETLTFIDEHSEVPLLSCSFTTAGVFVPGTVVCSSTIFTRISWKDALAEVGLTSVSPSFHFLSSARVMSACLIFRTLSVCAPFLKTYE
jgi:hypothetical protein